MKIKKGDKVKILAGKDAGKESTVEKVYPKQNTVLLMNANMYKKHIKKSEKVPQGGVVDIPRPLDLAKVALLCPKCKKPTRVGYEVEQGGKVRICKKCKERI